MHTGSVRLCLFLTVPELFSCSLVAELGSVFYSVKEKNFDERGLRKKADREFSRKAELESEMARQREQ
jgi:hypothetical protein